jgi:hypothetical protein
VDDPRQNGNPVVRHEPLRIGSHKSGRGLAMEPCTAADERGPVCMAVPGKSDIWISIKIYGCHALKMENLERIFTAMLTLFRIPYKIKETSPL